MDRALVIEDDPDIADLISIHLTDLEYNVFLKIAKLLLIPGVKMIA